jgi:hypothetical protein
MDKTFGQHATYSMDKTFTSRMAKIAIQPAAEVTLCHTGKQGPSLEGSLSRHQQTASVTRVATDKNKTHEMTEIQSNVTTLRNKSVATERSQV